MTVGEIRFKDIDPTEVERLCGIIRPHVQNDPLNDLICVKVLEKAARECPNVAAFIAGAYRHAMAQVATAVKH